MQQNILLSLLDKVYMYGGFTSELTSVECYTNCSSERLARQSTKKQKKSSVDKKYICAYLSMFLVAERIMERQSKYTYIEQHYAFSVSEFEGLWEMTFMHPFNREEHVSIYVVAPNSDSDYNSDNLKDLPIVKAGPRLTEIMEKLLYKIEFYPYAWDLNGKKIVSYGYDFESNYGVTDSISYIDLTEIAYKEVNEHYNFFSPLESSVVQEGEKVSGNGVMSKIKISFNRAKNVNHLAINYFTAYPIELVSLMYKEDENVDTLTHEIPLSKVVQTSRSIHLHFATVFAKTFYLIIKQSSYSIENTSYNENKSLNEMLWNTATERSRAVFESAVEEYAEQFVVTKPGIELHQEVLDTYKNISKTRSSNKIQSFDRYRDDFKTIKKSLDEQQH